MMEVDLLRNFAKDDRQIFTHYRLCFPFRYPESLISQLKTEPPT